MRCVYMFCMGRGLEEVHFNMGMWEDLKGVNKGGVFKNSVYTVEQVVACALVTQRARVRFPVGTYFLGEVFSVFFLTCKTNVRKL